MTYPPTAWQREANDEPPSSDDQISISQIYEFFY